MPEISQYIEACLIFEVMQEAATRGFGDKQRLTLVKYRIEIDAVRAHLRANDCAKKGITTGFTGRREAGKNLLGAGCAEEFVGRVFDRVTAMHTISRKHEIESRLKPVVHGGRVFSSAVLLVKGRLSVFKVHSVSCEGLFFYRLNGA